MSTLTPITARNSEGYEAPVGLAADPVVFTVRDDPGGKPRLEVLLIPRVEEPHLGCYACPGGFVGRSEDPADTVVRKLSEKTGMPPIYLEQLGTYARPERDPRGWIPSIAYLALVPASKLPEPVGGAAWFPVESLPPLAFDHGQIIQDGQERLRGKVWESNIAVGLLPSRFTIGQAREVYDAVAGTETDPGNFQRRILGTGLLTRAGGQGIQRSGGGPRATAYRFKSAEPTWIKPRAS